MSDEPFGRQPQPVTITFFGANEDVDYWMRHIKRSCEFKGDLVSHVAAGQLIIYPRAVND